MRKFAVAAVALSLMMSAPAYAAAVTNQVEMELMTWPELKAAIEAGKTTAIVYTGGTEQRGPQNVIGGHQFMGKPLALDIARKLGNAIVFPVMPYTPTGMSKDTPGSINLSADALGRGIVQQISAVMDAVGHRAEFVTQFWERVEKIGIRDVWKERNSLFGKDKPL